MLTESYSFRSVITGYLMTVFVSGVLLDDGASYHS